MSQLRRFTLKLCQSITLHQKFFFILEDEQELSLGMLDMSPTNLQFFIVPCYYIICFGCLMGFNIPIYIIFGTNLLTESPVQIAVFLPILVFRRKGNQTESKQNETFARIFFGTNAIQETWSESQGSNEAATRQEGAQGGRRAPTLVCPS